VLFPDELLYQVAVKNRIRMKRRRHRRRTQMYVEDAFDDEALFYE
jgi:hypothetical protein